MDNKSQKIFDRGYQSDLKEVVRLIITYDDLQKAAELSAILDKALVKNAKELAALPKDLAFYREMIVKLKFVCLPAIDDSEVISLIKNNFCLQFELPGYDLLKKISEKFLNILAVKDRNVFKESLVRVLSENNERITENHEIKTVGGWVKDYITKVGLDYKDNLEKVQYLVKLRDSKILRPEQIDHLILLFKLYDFLNTPSDTPEGFDEEMPIVVDGKLCIFRKGFLEPVEENRKVLEALKFIESQPANRDILAEADAAVSSGQSVPASSVSPTLVVSTPAAPVPAASAVPRTAELEAMLTNYPPDSLEYKAISQEILRLKKVEARKNVKK